MGPEPDANPSDLCGLNLNSMTETERLLHYQEDLLGDSSDEVAETLVALADQHWNDSNQSSIAENCLLRALDIKTKHLGFSHPDIIPLLEKLTKRYRDKGRETEASKLDRWRQRAMAKISGEFPIAAVAQGEQQSSRDAGATNLTPALYVAPAIAAAPVDAVPSLVAEAAPTNSPRQGPIPVIMTTLIKPGSARSISYLSLDNGERHDLRQDTIFIGTGPMNDLTLEDPTVEKFQATIRREKHEFFLSDSSQKRSTLLNGRPLTKERTKLCWGDMIKMGNTEIRVG
jgi:hypothetical protein